METIRQRLIKLYSENRSVHDEMDLPPADLYEFILLKALHPLGQVSNTPLPIPLPEYDGIGDLRNIQIALSRINASITKEIHAINTEQ